MTTRLLKVAPEGPITGWPGGSPEEHKRHLRTETSELLQQLDQDFPMVAAGLVTEETRDVNIARAMLLSAVRVLTPQEDPS